MLVIDILWLYVHVYTTCTLIARGDHGNVIVQSIAQTLARKLVDVDTIFVNKLILF